MPKPEKNYYYAEPESEGGKICLVFIDRPIPTDVLKHATSLLVYGEDFDDSAFISEEDRHAPVQNYYQRHLDYIRENITPYCPADLAIHILLPPSIYEDMSFRDQNCYFLNDRALAEDGDAFARGDYQGIVDFWCEAIDEGNHADAEADIASYFPEQTEDLLIHEAFTIAFNNPNLSANEIIIAAKRRNDRRMLSAQAIELAGLMPVLPIDGMPATRYIAHCFNGVSSDIVHNDLIKESIAQYTGIRPLEQSVNSPYAIFFDVTNSVSLDVTKALLPAGWKIERLVPLELSYDP